MFGSELSVWSVCRRRIYVIQNRIRANFLSIYNLKSNVLVSHLPNDRRKNEWIYSFFLRELSRFHGIIFSKIMSNFDCTAVYIWHIFWKRNPFLYNYGMTEKPIPTERMNDVSAACNMLFLMTSDPIHTYMRSLASKSEKASSLRYLYEQFNCKMSLCTLMFNIYWRTLWRCHVQLIRAIANKRRSWIQVGLFAQASPNRTIWQLSKKS